MSNRIEILEATLNLIEEGVAVFDGRSKLVFWNSFAEAMTGYSSEEILLYRPGDLFDADDCCNIENTDSTIRTMQRIDAACSDGTSCLEAGSQRENRLHRPTLASMRHKLGHSVPVMLHEQILGVTNEDPLGKAFLFYPVEATDSLPRGDCGGDLVIERSQTDMEDRLDAAHHQWLTSCMPFGLLWIKVDQAPSLRKTHGKDACEEMLRTLEQTLFRQMKPGEVIGRWGCDEFLVLAHERTTELLLERARRLTGLARTADFRWWGDRVGLTVSIGASQAAGGKTLQSLLDGAGQAMQASEYSGGNGVTEARVK